MHVICHHEAPKFDLTQSVIQPNTTVCIKEMVLESEVTTFHIVQVGGLRVQV